MATASAHSASVKHIDRRETARRLLQKELEQLPPDERHVVERFISRRKVARNMAREFHQSRTLGEQLADNVAAVGGSWKFIICFAVVLVVWMAINSFLLRSNAFDPFPYILLNLVLSCLAAIQAPIIMMSQKRQSEADRVQAQHDYEVNIKSELEILQVHEKLNALRDSEVAELLDKTNQMILRMEKIEQRLGSGSQDASASDGLNTNG